MKIIRQLLLITLITAVFVPSTFGIPTVNTWAVSPTYPTMDSSITIYVNVLSTDILQNGSTINKDSTVTAYTGLITSASTDITNSWKHIKNSGWSDLSIPMTRVNDSIFSLTINNPVSFFGVDTSTEAVYRITFIARGTDNLQVSGQTNNLYIDVYGSQPTKLFSYLPKNPTDKQMICVTFDLNDTVGVNSGMQGYTDTAYVHTWINNASGPWTGPAWGDNADKYRCIRINDSIRRWYIMPTTRTFFSFAAWTVAPSIGVLVRSKTSNIQTQDFTIPIMSQMDVNLADVKPWLMLPPYPTVNDPINIFFDAKNYKRANGDTLNPASTLSAWSGLVTSASTNMGDWRHQVNSAWSDFGDSTLFTRINDSIFMWSIPSIATKYNFDKSKETVYRIALIARDTLNGQVNKQTDDTYFEVYGTVPRTVVSKLPSTIYATGSAAITLDTKECGCNLSTYNDTVYAHTGLVTTSSTSDGDWKFIKTDWGVNSADTRLYQVNDSVYRYFIFPSIHSSYKTNNTENIQKIGFVFRSKTAPFMQTDSLYVTVMDTLTIPTAISIVNNSNDFAVYPNPVSEVLYLKTGANISGPITFSVYDLLGKKLYENSYQVNENDVIRLNVDEITKGASKGVLIYRIQSEKGSVQGKLIVY